MNYNLDPSPGWWNLGPIGIRNNSRGGFLVSNMYDLSPSKAIYAVLGPKFLRFKFFLTAWGPNQPTGPRSGILIPTPPCFRPRQTGEGKDEDCQAWKARSFQNHDQQLAPQEKDWLQQEWDKKYELQIFSQIIKTHTGESGVCQDWKTRRF